MAAPAGLVRRTVLAVAVLITLSTGACSSSAPPSEVPVSPRAELTARPSLEEITARYREMQDRVRAAVDAVAGPQAWRQIDPVTEGTCGADFPAETDARTVDLGIVGFRANVPDARWPAVEQAVLAVVRDYGFTAPAELRIDRPGQHVVGADDPALGAFFTFRTQVATTMRITSGCHLPAVPGPRPGG